MSSTRQQRDLEFEAILERVRQVRNFDFRNYKRATLQRRIDRRMAVTQCRTRAAYLALLQSDPTEVTALISSMLIKLTTFFRDREVWARLEEQLKGLVRARRPGQEARIWSAGCATGEEAYSIAILAAEALGSANPGAELKVFGTDVDEAAIVHGRRGVYSAHQLQGVSPERLERWFVRQGDTYAVRKELRRSVVFGVNNLVSDAPVSRIDLLLCRNVFIYMDADLQKRVLARFHFSLRHEGLLVLGRSELIPFAARLFEPVDLSRRIYVKDNNQESPRTPRELRPLEPAPEAPPNAEVDELRERQRQIHEMVHAQPCPLIATDLEDTIVLFNTAAARLWNRRESDVLHRKLSHVGLEGLTPELLVEQSARVRAGRSEREVSNGVMELPNQPIMDLRTTVVPLKNGRGDTEGLLYTSHDTTALVQMEQSLKQANAELQNVNLRLQSFNEELRSSNEELETTNEELQSANEELETTNEELQSANAELDSINRELAHRTEELDALGFSQRTIIRSLTAAVLVLDDKGQITTWNLAAERLLGLTEREALGQVLWTLRVPALKRSLQQRIRRSFLENRPLRQEHVLYELPHGGQGYATVVATPLTGDSRTLGSVILFEDTTRSAAFSQENRELKERLKGRPQK